MTNEQLTEKVVEIAEHQAKSDANYENILSSIEIMKEDIRATKNLAEDVHIMAINMQNMQKAQEETNKKVDALASKEFIEYTENKKIIKQNILNKISGGIIGVVITGIGWLLSLYFMGGK